MAKGTTDDDRRKYLEDGGWIENHRGWWHPPSCLASWPIGEAYVMAAYVLPLASRFKSWGSHLIEFPSH